MADDRVQAAKEIRRIVRATFPTVKFTVRLDRYSMGDSIDVRWTDGPTTKTVEDAIRGFEHIDHDAFTGEILSGGNSFVFCHREKSPETWAWAQAERDRRFARATWQNAAEWDSKVWEIWCATTFSAGGVVPTFCEMPGCPVVDGKERMVEIGDGYYCPTHATESHDETECAEYRAASEDGTCIVCGRIKAVAVV